MVLSLLYHFREDLGKCDEVLADNISINQVADCPRKQSQAVSYMVIILLYQFIGRQVFYFFLFFEHFLFIPVFLQYFYFPYILQDS